MVLIGVKLYDFNCGLKVYKKEVLDCIKVYGELYCYILVLVYSLGFKIIEVVVEYYSCIKGKFKYGLECYICGFIDLLIVLVIIYYLYKLGYLFGSLGLLFGVIGMIFLGYLIVFWFMEI